LPTWLVSICPGALRFPGLRSHNARSLIMFPCEFARRLFALRDDFAGRLPKFDALSASHCTNDSSSPVIANQLK
jgi:hypothetical protein